MAQDTTPCAPESGPAEVPLAAVHGATLVQGLQVRCGLKGGQLRHDDGWSPQDVRVHLRGKVSGIAVPCRLGAGLLLTQHVVEESRTHLQDVR
jgi:hypothetical protein